MISKADNILLKNGTIIDPWQGSQPKGDISVKNGVIAQIGSVPSGFKGKVFDIEGCVVAPGFLDLHCHLREPGREDEETIESGAEAALAGGFTGICPMPNTSPAIDTEGMVRFIKERSDDLMVDVYPIAAITKGRGGKELTEAAELKRAGAVALSDDGDPVSDTRILRRALEYAGMFDLTIIDHCEDRGLSHGGVMHEGLVSTSLGMGGVPSIAEAAVVARDLLVAEYTQGKLHIAHVSAAESVRLIREAKSRGVPVTCEVTPHHFSLTDEAIRGFDTNTKMNPPLGSEADRRALLEGLADGTIDCIATDHAPHSPEEKETEYNQAPFGVIGLETALGLGICQLVEEGILTMQELIARMAVAPRKILNLSPNEIKVGKPANLVVFNPAQKWVVKKEHLRSKSRNTPFDGWEFKGKVLGCFNRGQYIWMS